MEENQNLQEKQASDNKENIIIAPRLKRDWASYIKEFIMLFLAVFAGFMAENYRQNLSEQQTEKQYINSFIEDLKTDTSSIKQILKIRQRKMEVMDSLIYLLRSQQIKGHENELYFLGRVLVRSTRFQSNDRTITQLKSSGSLRLIRNEGAADSMISYQKLVEYIYYNQEDDRIERRAADPILSRIFDPFVLYEMVTMEGISRPANNPTLRSYDPKLFQDLAYYLQQLKGSNLLIESRLMSLHNKATNTIIFLKAAYKLPG
ncbi:MAG: hypothetical protein IPO92_22450 [Saprospiraceae bacterium]|nr:hypothetical protein [Saprospiraceae bacterium]